MLFRRGAVLATGIALPACGLLVGVEPLEVAAGVGVDANAQPSEVPALDGGDRSSPDEASASKPLTPPADGTYTYAVTTGSDKIQGFLQFVEPYGGTATVTVQSLGDGCFKEVFVLREGYVDTMNFCIRGAEVVQTSGFREQSFALDYTVQTTTTCAQGDIYFSSVSPPKDPWMHDCSGGNVDDESGSSFRTLGPYSFVSNDVIQVMGQDVPVQRFHDDRVVSGSQEGTNVADWYVSAENGLPIRLVRDINIRYEARGVDYIEHLDMTLTSLSPTPDAASDLRITSSVTTVTAHRWHVRCSSAARASDRSSRDAVGWVFGAGGGGRGGGRRGGRGGVGSRPHARERDDGGRRDESRGLDRRAILG